MSEEKNNHQNNAQDGSEDDVVFEEEGEAATDTIKKLRERLKKALSEKQEYLEGWQRMKADIANTKRSSDEQQKRFAALANEKLIRDLLPALDSFDMAFAGDGWEQAPENWRRGVEYIYSQLLSILESYSVSQFDPVGAPFDPKEHDSAETVPTDEKDKDDTVASVLQKGYRLNDVIIRPARVTVFSYTREGSEKS